MKKIKLALLYGGDSSEREISIRGWKEICRHLDPLKYELFHYDLRHDLSRLVDDAPRLDAAFICMHGRGGEDGSVQGLLELLKLPYQGSGVLASAMAMDKLVSKQLYVGAGLTVPRSLTLNRGQALDMEAVRQILPCMVKPVREGSSLGATVVREAEEVEEAVRRAFTYDRRILLEEYLEGVEVTGAVLGLDHLQALPLVEIVPRGGHIFFNFEAKYDAAATEEICPARLSPDLTSQAQQAALTAHQVLGCRGYSRTDMIIKQGKVYVLETNTIPGMTENSLLPKAAKAAGIEFPQLLDILIDLALKTGKE